MIKDKGFWFLTAIIIVFVLSTVESHAECTEIYLKVGSGYKFAENDSVTLNGVDYEIDHSNPISARIEAGVDCGRLSYGIAHHSQWATGFPFNEQKEWQKTEFFFDYKFSWGL